MKLGILLDYSGRVVSLPMDTILEAERLGFDSVWVAEAWSSDAISMAAYILAKTSRINVGTAIMQIPARTPANAAQTAMTLTQLSGGRFIPGLGASGPQVVEGWHGSGYAKPVQRSREYIEIMRKVMKRGKSEYNGEIYNLPFKGKGSTGLGKPLKSILRAEEEVRIYSASFTSAGLRMSGEVADGVIPIMLSPRKFDLFQGALEQGFSIAGNNKGFHNFDVAPFVIVSYGDDLEECRRPVREFLALYAGGMGAKSKNFYNAFVKKLGYVEEAEIIQDLFLSGRKEEAILAVPNDLIDEIAIVGDEARIRDQAEKWRSLDKQGVISTMICRVPNPKVLPILVDIFG